MCDSVCRTLLAHRGHDAQLRAPLLPALIATNLPQEKKPGTAVDTALASSCILPVRLRGNMTDRQILPTLLSWCTEVGIQVDSRLTLVEDKETGCVSVHNHSGMYIDCSTTREFGNPSCSQQSLSFTSGLRNLLRPYRYPLVLIRASLFELRSTNRITESGHDTQDRCAVRPLLHALGHDPIRPLRARRASRPLTCPLQRAVSVTVKPHVFKREMLSTRPLFRHKCSNHATMNDLTHAVSEDKVPGGPATYCPFRRHLSGLQLCGVLMNCWECVIPTMWKTLLKIFGKHLHSPWTLKYHENCVQKMEGS